jgi:hypothetical protein
MGAAIKAAFAAGIVFLVLAYVTGSVYVEEALAKKADSLSREKMLYDARRDRLFVEQANLEAVRQSLAAQLEYELESRRQRQEAVAAVSAADDGSIVVDVPTAENLSTAVDPFLAEKARQEALLKAQAEKARQEQMKRLAEIQAKAVRSSSSGGGGVSRVTSAS